MTRSILLFAILFLGASAVQAQTLRFFEFGFRNPLPDSVNVIAATHDTAVIAKALEQLTLPESERSHFINGELQYGTETNNPLYSWHFVTDSWDLVETAVEICDGRPDDVENNKQYWIETVGYFCPWTSFTKREIFPADVRENIEAGIRIFPNPTRAMVSIDIPSPHTIRELCVMDASGKIVTNVPPQNRTIDLSRLPAGAYYVIVHSSSGYNIYKIAKTDTD